MPDPDDTGIELEHVGRAAAGGTEHRDLIGDRLPRLRRERRVGAPSAFPIGTRLRVLPNHACATAAQHSGYHLVDGGWRPRFNGWRRRAILI